jgi:hypothetical protein
MDNDISYFSSLSNDQIIDIALNLNREDIGYYCLYNSHFNTVICNNQWVWEQKFLIDFGPPEYDFVGDWKSLYQNFGSVYVFGSNSASQLGLGDTVSRSTPIKIPHFYFRAISAGGYHTSAIDFNDDVWTFGLNNFGQLGLGDTDDKTIPTKIDNFKATAREIYFCWIFTYSSPRF